VEEGKGETGPIDGRPLEGEGKIDEGRVAPVPFARETNRAWNFGDWLIEAVGEEDTRLAKKNSKKDKSFQLNKKPLCRLCGHNSQSRILN